MVRKIQNQKNIVRKNKEEVRKRTKEELLNYKSSNMAMEGKNPRITALPDKPNAK